MTTLVTWNCDMAFRKKGKILQYDPGILVIQDCEDPDTKGDRSEFSDRRWIGENEHKGLAVFSRNDYSLESTAVEGRGGQLTIPITTDGPVDMLGAWAINDEQNPEKRYIGQVYTTIQEYREFIDTRTAVLGDFNWNSIWDESPKSPLWGDFSDTVDILNAHGLQSVYHTLYDYDFGSEAAPTFFMYKKRDRGYHIGYVFLPEMVAESGADLSVGEYGDRIDASDHMPIIVEL